MPQTRCPHCAEPLDVWPDPGGGEEQEFIEDCAVCCRPVRVVAHYDPELDGWHLEAAQEK